MPERRPECLEHLLRRIERNAAYQTGGTGTPQSTGEYIRREQAQWREFAKELGVEAQ
jgi:hypothetical protein